MKTGLNSFVVANPRKCIGCKACEVACFAVHNEDDKSLSTVGSIETPIIPRLFTIKAENFVMPIQCRHCEDAPCANSCTAGAIKQVGNSIVVEEENCVGCKACMLACPFGAIDLFPRVSSGQVEEEKIVAYKCDLCAGKDTQACVKACPKEALTLIVPGEDRLSKNKKAAASLIQTVKSFK